MILDEIKRLEDSEEFSSWKKGHKEGYLVHCFKMLDKQNENTWQIGYFNPETNLISVFNVSDTIAKGEDAEVFKEQEKLVNPLRVEDVEIDEDDCLAKGKEVLSDNYKGVSVFKAFMILQNIDQIGQVWNITFITDQFKTVNVKINSKTGECVGHKMISLIQDMK